MSNVPEYEHIRKWMVEFPGRFQGRGIKIAQLNSIPVAKPLILFNILRAVPPQVTSSWAIVFFELKRIPS